MWLSFNYSFISVNGVLYLIYSYFSSVFIRFDLNIRIFIILLILHFVGQNVYSQADEMIDTLLNSKIKELGVREVTVWVRTKSSYHDTTQFNETKRYDRKGNRVEHFFPYGRGLERRVYKYDSLDRTVAFFRFDNKDTTKVISEKYWTFIDSAHTKTELYHLNHELYSREFSNVELDGDTVWFHHDKTEFPSKRREVKATRYRVIGDTLAITEYIKYDDSLKLSKIDAYFKVTRQQSDSTFLYMEGQYILASEAFDDFHVDRELMIDYYRNPDKYLQMQLDGKFPYEYHPDPFIYRILDSRKRIIQDGVGWSKVTFEYDDSNRLLKTVSWGMEEGEYYGPLIQTGTKTYYYREDGLPEKIVGENLKNGNLQEVILEYQFYQK